MWERSPQNYGHGNHRITSFKTLLEHGANLNAKDFEGKTPLHIAIENQHAQIITLLLSQPGIDLSARDNKGVSPFAAALTARNNKAAQAILEKNPSAAEQVDKKGRNFLHVAIQNCDMESVMFLLSVEVDVNSRVQDSSLTPPLHLAAAGGNEVLLRSLLLAGARANDRDANKRTALHVAAQAGHAAIVSALLSHGAECDALDAAGENALHIAAREGHAAAVRALLADSEIDAAAANLKGRNPLHELCWCKKDNAATICELFLEFMPEYPINRMDMQGNTPLLLAYMNGQGAMCRALVRAGACLAAENKEGVSIFNYQVILCHQFIYVYGWPILGKAKHGGDTSIAAPAARRAPGRGAVGRERPLPGVQHQVHAHHEETSLPSLRSHALQQVFEPRRTYSQVRAEQAAARLRDLLQRAPGGRQLARLDGRVGRSLRRLVSAETSLALVTLYCH
ncbi:Rabankyrin-5 [Eumeta japonica]|uniref:Rabankyrin-5 n=1 Tax=Eumeta variegata TaxID=151549 RepID=A0A4C1YFG3_EUMVA|nr:Rabankyrin-5 [Eumeta japonica]